MGENLIRMAEETVNNLPMSSICRQLLESTDPPILPPTRDMRLRAFREAVEPIRVVVIGQDPYPSTDSKGNPKATGLAFEVSEAYRAGEDIEGVLESLWRMNLRMARPRATRSLQASSLQGVLWVNAALTVSKNEDHTPHWREWAERIIGAISRQEDPPVFLILGSPAEDLLWAAVGEKPKGKRGAFLKSISGERRVAHRKKVQELHRYVFRVHPSTQARLRAPKAWDRCWGSDFDRQENPFLDINELLPESSKIKWHCCCLTIRAVRECRANGLDTPCFSATP